MVLICNFFFVLFIVGWVGGWGPGMMLGVYIIKAIGKRFSASHKYCKFEFFGLFFSSMMAARKWGLRPVLSKTIWNGILEFRWSILCTVTDLCIDTL